MSGRDPIFALVCPDVYIGQNLKIYVNGVLKQTTSAGGSYDLNDSSDDLLVGEGLTGYMDDIKDSISFSNREVEIRGELYLPKNTVYDTKGKPLRNNCVGLINRKEGHVDLKYVRFVCYQINSLESSPTESGKIKLLNKEGFHTVTFSRISSLDEINEMSLFIYNINGRIIKHISIDPKTKQLPVDISAFTNGLYLVRLNQATKAYHGRLLIQK